MIRSGPATHIGCFQSSVFKLILQVLDLRSYTERTGRTSPSGRIDSQAGLQTPSRFWESVYNVAMCASFYDVV